MTLIFLFFLISHCLLQMKMHLIRLRIHRKPQKFYLAAWQYPKQRPVRIMKKQNRGFLYDQLLKKGRSGSQKNPVVLQPPGEISRLAYEKQRMYSRKVLSLFFQEASWR